MPTPTNPNELAISVCLPRELRLRLEQLRVRRAESEKRIPTLRALMIEAVTNLVEKEPTFEK